MFRPCDLEGSTRFGIVVCHPSDKAFEKKWSEFIVSFPLLSPANAAKASATERGSRSASAQSGQLSAHLWRIEAAPFWDPLRGEPCFEEIVA